ncbi:MAG: hypothetical protein ACYC4P_07190 [Thermoanaerobaculia bacterium]
MSTPTRAERIGDALLADDLVAEALEAYSADFPDFEVEWCVLHLVRTCLSDFGYLSKKMIPEFHAGPKLLERRSASTTPTEKKLAPRADGNLVMFRRPKTRGGRP